MRLVNGDGRAGWGTRGGLRGSIWTLRRRGDPRSTPQRGRPRQLQTHAAVPVGRWGESTAAAWPRHSPCAPRRPQRPLPRRGGGAAAASGAADAPPRQCIRARGGAGLVCAAGGRAYRLSTPGRNAPSARLWLQPSGGVGGDGPSTVKRGGGHATSKGTAPARRVTSTRASGSSAGGSATPPTLGAAVAVAVCRCRCQSPRDGFGSGTRAGADADPSLVCAAAGRWMAAAATAVRAAVERWGATPVGRHATTRKSPGHPRSITPAKSACVARLCVDRGRASAMIGRSWQVRSGWRDCH